MHFSKVAREVVAVVKAIGLELTECHPIIIGIIAQPTARNSNEFARAR